MAVLYAVTKDYQKALPLAQRAAETAVRQLESVSSVQSENQQMKSIQTSRNCLNVYISCTMLAIDTIDKKSSDSKTQSGSQALATDEKHSADELARNAYANLLAWKGAVLSRQR